MGYIDYLNKKFPSTDFRDPFTDWSEIMKKIESKFIIKNSDDYHFSNWEDNIKSKTLIREVSQDEIYKEIEKLGINSNYWIVIVTDNSPTAKHLVYDSKINALSELISRFAMDFYIIDKKYTWLTFFKTDKEKKKTVIFKSGSTKNPFDNN